jgi:tripartite-type tricarboxylate transporter receptor subunit TctC
MIAMITRLVIGIFGLTLVGALIASADESWPNRPIRMVVPVAAGGGVDTMARIMAAPLIGRAGKWPV